MKTFQKGFSLVELLLVVVIIGVLAAIAIPNLVAARRSANEGSALSSLRTLHVSQIIFARTNGGGSYSPNLSGLRNAYLIDEVLSQGSRSGYEFKTFSSGSGNDADFAVGASPTVYTGINATGAKKFCMAAAGILRAENAPAQIGTNITQVSDCNTTNFTLNIQ